MMKASSVARAYSSADLSSKTDGRKPEELLILLLDKACSCLRRAAMLPMDTLEDASWEERLQITQDFHNNCSRAMQIVVALRELLDLEAGGELAAQLQETYTAIATTIWDASKAKNVTDLAKMLEALIELRSAWETVASG